MTFDETVETVDDLRDYKSRLKETGGGGRRVERRRQREGSVFLFPVDF